MRHQATPSRLSASVFRGKATLLQLRRAARDVAGGVSRFPRASVADFPFVIAQSRTPLWSEDAAVEAVLQRGKVQNLRRAVLALNGARIAAGETFSFWKQIGRATRRRGYTEGRLLREGCLMPAVGGGLCQLSNALYDVALSAQLEIVERWGHSRVVPGSAAALGRDATVAWNYIDLRFRAPQEFAIEAFLSADELVVQLRARQALPRPEADLIPLSSLGEPRPLLDVRAHSCASCGQESCFRHQTAPAPARGRNAFLVDECWPEFQSFVARNHAPQDVLALPLDGARWHQARYAWPTGGFAQIHAATLPTLARSLATRRLGAYGAARLQAQIEGAQKLAAQLARALTPDVSHVVVAQSLLPFLWRDGHLGGRTVEVLMTRLPLHVLQARLNAAASRHPARTTLTEFRAPVWLVEAERAALENARVVTPHAEIAALFGERATHLDWHLPARTDVALRGASAIVFPGPVAARKGAYEVRGAARALGLEVLLRGSELEGENFWCGIATRRATENWLQDAMAVVQPALIEDQPRRLLQALAAGVPVIATAACGLAPQPGLTLVEAENEAALIAALRAIQME